MGILLLAAAAVAAFLWNRYLNKNSLIRGFETQEGQQVYLLGTFHENHFDRWLGYSMEDVLSAVENVDPDVVFLEARQSVLEEYGVVDGPVDMAVVYSYCTQNRIPAALVDWWVVDNEYRSNTTNEKRDDRIFANISEKLKKIRSGSKVLIVCGAGHFYEQADRLLQHGARRLRLTDPGACFEADGGTFHYPENVEEVWEQRAYFYAYLYPELVGADETLSEEIKADFTGGDHDAFYEEQLEYCELFAADLLYR